MFEPVAAAVSQRGASDTSRSRLVRTSVVSLLIAGGLCLAAAPLMMACGGSGEAPYIQSEERTTQALITIKRESSPFIQEVDSSQIDDDGTPPVATTPVYVIQSQATAQAHFVSLPQYSEPDRVLDIAGLARALPAINECRVTAGTDQQQNPSVATLGHIELLEAGTVSIGTPRNRISLAPRAFPTVSAFVSGMMYTTRDQSPGPLPVGLPYRVQVGGAGGLPPFSLVATAPDQLEHVNVSGVSLPELTAVSVEEPIDITWTPSPTATPTDTIVAELATRFDGPNVRCAFRDDVGVGTIPAKVTRTLEGAGRFVMHRIRRDTHALGLPGLDTARLEFDFGMGREVIYQKSR